PDCVLRYTNFVENMCPVFRTPILEQLRWTLAESISGWGLAWLWAGQLPYPAHRLAIVDAVPVRHTRPVGVGSLYQVLRQMGVQAPQEKADILRKFNLPPPVITEYGRVAIPLGLRLWHRVRRRLAG